MRCSFVKADGSPCRGSATGGAAYCYAHDPARAGERKRNAIRGGKAGGNGRPGSATNEIREAKAWTKGLVAKLLAGDVPRDIATAAFQGLNTLARYIEVERKVRELEEIEQRLAALEEADGGGTAWHR